MPAVTIFCKGETPLADWTSSGNFTFGFCLNEELLSMSYADTDEMTSTPHGDESLNSTSTTLTLTQEDNAIVSFGESLDDLKLTVSPESGISLEAGQDQDGSGTSTPQYFDSGASSWADQQVTLPHLILDLKKLVSRLRHNFETFIAVSNPYFPLPSTQKHTCSSTQKHT